MENFKDLNPINERWRPAVDNLIKETMRLDIWQGGYIDCLTPAVIEEENSENETFLMPETAFMLGDVTVETRQSALKARIDT